MIIIERREQNKTVGTVKVGRGVWSGTKSEEKVWKIAETIVTAAVTITNSFEHELGRRRKTKQHTYCPLFIYLSGPNNDNFSSRNDIILLAAFFGSNNSARKNIKRNLYDFT